MLKVGSPFAIGKRDVTLQAPRLPLSSVPYAAGVVILHALAEIICQPGIETLFVHVALKNVDVVHKGLPSRSSLRHRSKVKHVRLR